MTDDDSPGLNPVQRRVLVSRNLPNRPDANLELADDGYRIWVRESPQISVNCEGWHLLWEYKHFDIQSFARVVVDAIFASHSK